MRDTERLFRVSLSFLFLASGRDFASGKIFAGRKTSTKGKGKVDKGRGKSVYRCINSNYVCVYV